MCRGTARIKRKAVLKTDGFNWRVLVFWIQARSTIDSMSLLTMILNPDRAKDLSDMTNKLVRWDALIRDFAMKLDKKISRTKCTKQHSVENKLAGRRDLDFCAKVRCMTDDTTGDKRRARRAIKFGGGGQSAAGRHQLKVREVTSDFPDEASQGGIDTCSVQKLAQSQSATVETINSAFKGKITRKKKVGVAAWNQRASDDGRPSPTDTAERGRKAH